ncbi:MAG: dihydroorotase [Eubacteriales bacterium]|nr:dihydroorotase [Eubacteriales bacterium]
MLDRIKILDKCTFLPGFTDVHVHLREPGFLYKETIATGTEAAAAGGFTNICSMPNVKPCPDSYDNLRIQLEAIEETARIRVYPYGAITKDQKGRELAELESIAGKVIAFTDDGFGIMSDDLMREAMVRAKALGKMIVAHCEDERYPRNSNESEYKQLERDLNLVRQTGCSYHACHISTKESVQLIRRAKAEGLDVSCETAPHYLLLSRADVEDAVSGHNGRTGSLPAGWFKMNPPIKSEEDRMILLEAAVDGTVDMIATDHAPHSAEEKNLDFDRCAYGIVGLETAFPVLYTGLVRKDIISLDRLVEMMSTAPAERFGIKSTEDYSLWDLETECTVDSGAFKSKGSATPFNGWKVYGRCIKTVMDGKEVYSFEEQKSRDNK